MVTKMRLTILRNLPTVPEHVIFPNTHQKLEELQNWSNISLNRDKTGWFYLTAELWMQPVTTKHTHTHTHHPAALPEHLGTWTNTPSHFWHKNPSEQQYKERPVWRRLLCYPAALALLAHADLCSPVLFQRLACGSVGVPLRRCSVRLSPVMWRRRPHLLSWLTEQQTWGVKFGGFGWEEPEQVLAGLRCHVNVRHTVSERGIVRLTWILIRQQ